MRAMTIPDYGPPEILKLQDMPEPKPGNDDLLIEVHASSLNPVDYKIRSGSFRAERAMPTIPGYDVSGIVLETGKNTEGFKTGDEVYAFPSVFRDGAHAERVCVDYRAAAPKPTTLDHATAALLPLVTVTTWHAVHDRCRLHTGETILIFGGAGGCGHIGIQLAKAHGCRVLATAGNDASKALCAELGAEVIDYKTQDVVATIQEMTGGRGCEVVFDCVGAAVFGQAIACVAPEGRLATIVGIDPEAPLSQMMLKNAQIHPVFVGAPSMHGYPPTRHGQILRTAAELADAGKLAPHRAIRFPLEALADAHRQQESRRTVGKIGIIVR